MHRYSKYLFIASTNPSFNIRQLIDANPSTKSMRFITHADRLKGISFNRTLIIVLPDYIEVATAEFNAELGKLAAKGARIIDLQQFKEARARWESIK